MTWVGVAVGAAGIVGGVMSSNAQKDAARSASDAQTRSAQLGIDAQTRQFDEVRELLRPYVESGNTALSGQMDLLGLGEEGSQASAISNITDSDQFRAMTEQGENAILANASATGGLRGGNVQSSIAQFRPQLLSSMIDTQYNRLGGIANAGQASASGQAQMGQQSSANISGLLGDQGAAQAGNALAQGQAQTDMYGNLVSGIGNIDGQLTGRKF